MGAFQDYQDLSFKEGPKKSVFFSIYENIGEWGG